MKKKFAFVVAIFMAFTLLATTLADLLSNDIPLLWPWKEALHWAFLGMAVVWLFVGIPLLGYSLKREPLSA